MDSIAMKLQSKPFDLLVAGKKTVEVRLRDEKRRGVRIGDRILFSRLPGLIQTVLVEVTDIIQAPDFQSFFSLVSPEEIGAEQAYTITQFVADMHQYYSPENERFLGVVGFRIKPVF